MDTTKIRAKFSDTTLVKKTTAYYEKHKRLAPLLSFSAGFAWDNLTLGRIDLLTDNLLILAYIITAGILILTTNFVDDKIIKQPLIVQYREWYPVALQFFFGGLFSSYIVFYFRSATLSKNWLFLLFLAVILVGNEFIKNRLSSIKWQLSLYFLATFSFFIFSVPVLFKKMGTLIFLFSGILGLLPVLALSYIIYRHSLQKPRKQFRDTSIIIGSIYVFLVVLYFFNWIPPVPLSLEKGGIYHHVSRQGEVYQLKFEDGAWYQFWKNSDNSFHYAPGDTVFCFASVFAPTRLDTKIIHHWQRYDQNKEQWLGSDRLGYQIRGGRDGGYRGYTFKRNISPGEWRVDVKTIDDKLLGRISFRIFKLENSGKRLKTIYQ